MLWVGARFWHYRTQVVNITTERMPILFESLDVPSRRLDNLWTPSCQVMTQRVEVFYIQFHWLTIAGQKSPAGASFSEQDDSREQPGCVARVRFILAVADGEGNSVVGLQRDLA